MHSLYGYATSDVGYNVGSVQGFAMVLSSNYGPSIWLTIITYYLLKGNRVNVFYYFEK